MSALEYLEFVCESNKLGDNLVYIKDDGTPLYIDRHMPVPPESCPPEVACEAGIYLLKQWYIEAKALAKNASLVYEGPVLFIDDSWLAGLESAPPPHVKIYLAKANCQWGAISKFANAVVKKTSECPIASLLLKHIGETELIYIPARENFFSDEDELLYGGSWCIPPVSAKYDGSGFISVGNPPG